ncbi:hypothetical protein AB205_0217200 [Aquarana catesbeiana]|uniref:Uncharacterized protein n=1 Tax=Aquarana catesbeiana TaxID=8400 RepID=A0A2G9RXS0_AQUCT|nr:hypothetical protein AB205_0217200 [Aquarana catesbeiana]
MAGPRFPSRTLPEVSHCPHWLAFFQYCILVLSLSQVSTSHAPGHPHDVKENVIHQTRPLSSIAPWSSSF